MIIQVWSSDLAFGRLRSVSSLLDDDESQSTESLCSDFRIYTIKPYVNLNNKDLLKTSGKTDVTQYIRKSMESFVRFVFLK